MIPEIFSNYLEKKKTTLLAVGPMSKNCVDATIELSNRYNTPIMFIASRRQIDSKDFGGGYVNNWTTETFSSYVKKKDKKKLIILCRDHGGPWQHTSEKEKKMSTKEAMASAKKSFSKDIDAGFKIIHIDTSLSLKDTEKSKKKCLDRLFEIYEFCFSYAKKKGKKIYFEIGTEEQSGTTNTQEELEETLSKTIEFCNKKKFNKPTFVVIQSGTRVMETRNVGTFETPFRVENEIPAEIQVPKMIDICNKYDVFMKEHNTDYLSNEALGWHPRLGIHAANVAPEFGVTETKALILLMNKNRLKKMLDKFLEISYNSRKWEKWMIKNSNASNFDKSVISGHYIFSNPNFIYLKKELEFELKKKSINLDTFLKNEVKKNILRYLINFRMI
jgi:tagatose-1,6-bisphosphate aldolase non-catalytic subunit AgaZ/GatZ